MTTSVRVLAFAGARDIIGEGELTWDVHGPCSAGELLTRICERFPALTAYRASLRMAVNGRYTDFAAQVAAGDEVAILPPVAGG